MKNTNEEKEEIKDSIQLPTNYLDVELSENDEKIEALTGNQKLAIESICSWLIRNRNYKDYDIDSEFKVEKIIPLLKFVQNGEIIFESDIIIQKLRFPIELLDKNGNIHSSISQLTYKTRYRAHELNNATKGINISKEMNLYMDAQVGMLTDTARSIIGKLYDVDHSLTRLIQSLYFL